MNKEQIIKLAGSQSELARILGITRAAVNQWKQIPEGRLWQLRAIRPQWFSNEMTTFDV
jgi:DNA-binding transcriptional regulator YdaS (Cro superfamily)